VSADGTDPDGTEPDHPPLVRARDADSIAPALERGAIVALPSVGGYVLAVHAGHREAEARLDALVADPDGPHYQAANSDAVRALTSGWTEEIEQLLARCWPGPLELFLPRADAVAPDSDAETAGQPGGWALVVGTPDGRVLRRLCREHGPWRTAPLAYADAGEVVQAFDAGDVACVVDGGRREGPLPTQVDATVSPLRIFREGALPASFVEGAVLMNARRKLRLFRRAERPS
jgi:tRNA A37 threonylcarbamoyladenosine synthetase subunit TsaC/SUA5/YrdC